MPLVNSRDPQVQVKITSVVCSSVAISSTIYRLITRRRRLWADDAWAFFFMLSLFLQVTAVFMLQHPQHLGVTRYYLMAVSFYAIIWSARLSILFSMIRIDPHPGRRKAMLYIAILFFFIWLTLVAQLFWVCEPVPQWKYLTAPQCKLNEQVAICQLVSDIIADLILLCAPLQLFLLLQDKWLRYRLSVIFSTCIVTTIVSLVHAAYILEAAGPKVVIAALVEDCVSLIVCNIPVVVAGLIRLDHRYAARKEPRLSHMTSLMMFGRLSSSVSRDITRRIGNEDLESTDPSTDKVTTSFPYTN